MTGPGAATDQDAVGASLAEIYDVGLFDLDGVIYIGHDPVPGAAAALAKARAAGMRAAFVTNNASRTPSAVAALLTDLEVPATADDVVTSSQAAARLLAERLPAGSPVLVVGGTGLRHALYGQGLRPVSVAAARPVAVVQGFAPGLTYELMAEGGQAVAGGALFVGTNADSTIPSQSGRPRPGNGALLQVIATATGVDPIVTGKPERPLHREAMLRTGAKRPLVVGDRLDTDIEGAHNGGADSLLVLTGVTGGRALLAAPPNQRPTYVAADLTGLLATRSNTTIGGAAVPVGRASGTTAPDKHDDSDSNEGWKAYRSGDHIELDGDGDPVDGLRALCALAWQTPGFHPEMATKALAKLNLPA